MWASEKREGLDLMEGEVRFDERLGGLQWEEGEGGELHRRASMEVNE